MSTAKTQTPDAPAARAPARKGARIVIGLVCGLLIVFLGLEGMSLVAAQQTEHLRRKVGMAGGTCEFEKRVPGWLQSVAGEDFHTFMDYPVIVGVDMAGDEYGNSNLARFPMLDDLRRLDLHDTQVTSEGLRHVAQWKNIQILNLTNTQVTDVTPLAELPQLEWLLLNYSQVRREYLTGLAQLTHLEVLAAGYLQVTDPDVVEIAKCTGLTELSLAGSDLGEHGLQPLRSLEQLETLVLLDAKFNPADLKELQKTHPGLTVVK